MTMITNSSSVPQSVAGVGTTNEWDAGAQSACPEKLKCATVFACLFVDARHHEPGVDRRCDEHAFVRRYVAASRNRITVRAGGRGIL
jgi:hypothetical protein